MDHKMDEEPYIDIEPLQPPFHGNVVELEFEAIDKVLAVSRADYDRICNFLGTNNPFGREVLLACTPGTGRIRIKSVQ